jgi:FkbM family methyltransferase
VCLQKDSPISRARRYRNEVIAYWRDARTPRDFLRLMQVRLSLSKVGWLVCPHRVVARVDMRSFGGPVWLRSHTTDISVLKEQLIGDAYGAIDRHAETIGTVVDLGANTGLVARWLMHRHPAARMVCVEPDPGNLEVLERNVEGMPAAVVRACIGATERRVSLTTNTGEWGYRMQDGSPNGAVSVVTMGNLIAEHGLHRIDVLKCDIEGAERELFANAPWMDQVTMAVVECHGFPAEKVVPPGWRVAEREGNLKRPTFETVTLIRS